MFPKSAAGRAVRMASTGGHAECFSSMAFPIEKRGRTVSDIRGYIDVGGMNDMAGGESSARPGSTAVSVPYVSAKEIAFSGKPDSARNLFGGQGLPGCMEGDSCAA